MAVDPRQILAAFLTVSMFAMLGNMIKRDHFDFFQMSFQVRSDVHFMKLEDDNISEISPLSKNPWKVDSQQLKQCWTKPASKDIDKSNGLITFSLTNGPERHVSQLADAVVIARYLGATLVLPDIRGEEPGLKSKFQDMYDTEKLIKSLNGVIKIVEELPPETASRNPIVLRVPNRATEDFIAKNIEPIFRANSYVRLATYFPSINLKSREEKNVDLDSTLCTAMFGSLELNSEIQEVVEMMIRKLRSSNPEAGGQFVAIDLRTEVMEQRVCRQKREGTKRCYNALEIAEFLKKVGFGRNTTIYLTQTWWQESLDFFKAMYPNAYIKDDLIPEAKKGIFFTPGSAKLRRALDFYICSQSDAFVPAVSGLFSGVVAGRRIASGMTQILVPSSPPPDFLSPFVSQKNHLAYSCYC